MRSPGSPYRRAKLTPAQKEARHAKALVLASNVKQARNDIENQVSAVAVNNGRSKDWVKRQLFITGNVQKRAPNAWNGYIAGNLKAHNMNLPAGERKSLPQFLASDEGAKFKAEWEAMPENEKDVYRSDIKNMRISKQTIVRTNPRSVLTEVHNTFNRMENEWNTVENKTGGEGLYIFVRKDLNQYHAPKVHYTPLVEKFFKDVMSIEPEEMALRMEAYMVGGCAKGRTIKSTRTTVALISACRKLIQDGLNQILKEEGVDPIPMNYENYEARIVEAHGVVLEGWPNGPVRNPGAIGGGRGAVQKLLTALTNGECQWIKLSEEQHASRIKANEAAVARGESVYKPRKKSGGTGKDSFKSAELIDSDDDEHNNV